MNYIFIMDIIIDLYAVIETITYLIISHIDLNKDHCIFSITVKNCRVSRMTSHPKLYEKHEAAYFSKIFIGPFLRLVVFWCSIVIICLFTGGTNSEELNAFLKRSKIYAYWLKKNQIEKFRNTYTATIES